MQLENFFAPESLSSLAKLRLEVRDFLRSAEKDGLYRRTPDGWDRYDARFTKLIAKQGWIGMTWPKQYGGSERNTLERYVVTEELLTSGAPVRAHWLADRQIGPLMLAHGTEAQRQEFMPRIAAGECFFCLGLSEPNSGSDLASIKTKATKVDGGWSITGAKVWTSYAHSAHYMNLFARTSPRSEENRHEGVTQFVVDLKAKGVQVKPIINLARDHDFNEVVFDDVFVADDRVLGTVGNGWKQVSGELAHERSGPERWSASFGALAELPSFLRGEVTESNAENFGRMVAHVWSLHRMSFALAVKLDHGGAPNTEASMIKDLGSKLDQTIPTVVRQIVTEQMLADDSTGSYEAMLARATLYAPSFTIRSGTKEILRGIIARGLGLR